AMGPVDSPATFYTHWPHAGPTLTHRPQRGAGGKKRPTPTARRGTPVLRQNLFPSTGWCARDGARR
ncbi:hypothetical protein, partial [Corynebacterium diphtheriae]|uniref:hypothetical protein n=1 Tax=Corynebacterium diphtheriae TaxID=1717 RepID=UPI001C7DA149